MILGYPEETLRSANGLATAREIRQQPATWRETLTMVEECRATIERFLLPLLSRGNLRVILTGAGTSAFAGRALAPYLSARLNGRFEAIATTEATFATPGVNIGLFCSTPMVTLSRAVQPKHAMELLLTGAPMTAHSRRMGKRVRVKKCRTECGVVRSMATSSMAR